MHKYHFGDISVKPWLFYVLFGLFWSPKRGEWMVLEGYPKRPVRTGFERFFIGFSKIPKIRNCKLNQYCNCCNCNWQSSPNRLHSGPVHWFLTVLWTGLSNTTFEKFANYSTSITAWAHLITHKQMEKWNKLIKNLKPTFLSFVPQNCTVGQHIWAVWRGKGRALTVEGEARQSGGSGPLLLVLTAKQKTTIEGEGALCLESSV